MVVMLPTLPFRVALLVFAVFAVAACNTVAIRGCDLERPLPRWRRRMVELSSQFWNGVMLFAAGFWWPRVTGLENWEEAKRVGAVSCWCSQSACAAFLLFCSDRLCSALLCSLLWAGRKGDRAVLDYNKQQPTTNNQRPTTTNNQSTSSTTSSTTSTSTQIGVFNHVSYLDAFVITWALCPAGLTFQFAREVPVLGRAINALQVRFFSECAVCIV